VTVQDGVLTIQGQRKKETEEKNKRFHRIVRMTDVRAASSTDREKIRRMREGACANREHLGE